VVKNKVYFSVKYSLNQAYQKPLNNQGKLIRDKHHPYFIYHFLKKKIGNKPTIEESGKNIEVKFKLDEAYSVKKMDSFYLISFDFTEAMDNKMAENNWLLNQSYELIKTNRFNSNFKWVGISVYFILGLIINFGFDFNNLINLTILGCLFMIMTIIENNISRQKVLEADLKATNKKNYETVIKYLYKKHVADKNFLHFMNPISKFFLTILSPSPSYLQRAETIEKQKSRFL